MSYVPDMRRRGVGLEEQEVARVDPELVDVHRMRSRCCRPHGEGHLVALGDDELAAITRGVVLEVVVADGRLMNRRRGRTDRREKECRGQTDRSTPHVT